MKKQGSGMYGVYLVAAELARRGFTVCTTSRNAQGADLLVTDPECRRAFSVQVKANSKSRKNPYFIMGEKAKDMVSESHVYVLVDMPTGEPQYYVARSRNVAARIQCLKWRNSEWWVVWIRDLLPYKDRWDIFGKSED
jgi:hypothetical protein